LAQHHAFEPVISAGLHTVERNPMADQPIRLDDGAAYERMMGVWSRLAGEIFLDLRRMDFGTFFARN
jgi:hypothetical protein